jgi:3-hydroxyisobutyrate dehydrogenase-like beta-hydroxyacid dehydrogenase
MKCAAASLERMTSLSLLGLGAMGTALGRVWLAAGHSVTVWNRTRAKAEALTGATVADTAADAVAANQLVVLCLLDDASVGGTLDGADLAGRDVVNLTTGTPDEARARAAWVAERGGRLLDGGIMAVPSMIGEPDAGGYVLYSGDPAVFDTHQDVLAGVAGTRFVGADPGLAALHDVALLSAMDGMFAGVTHAFALLRRTDVPPTEFAPLLTGWLTAMAGAVGDMAERLQSGDFTTGVTSSLTMQAAGTATLERTATEQGVSTELLRPYHRLMDRHVAAGHGDEDGAGLVDLLRH